MRAPPFGNVLCATDFSPGSHAALRAAAQLCRDTGATLTIAYVWQPPGYVFGGEAPVSPALVQDLIDDSERRLDEARRAALDLGAREVTTLYRVGAAWDQICDAARTGNHDLVVVGTHGRTGLAHVLLGSVAERTLRVAPCSVLAVKAGSAGGH